MNRLTIGSLLERLDLLWVGLLVFAAACASASPNPNANQTAPETVHQSNMPAHMAASESGFAEDGERNADELANLWRVRMSEVYADRQSGGFALGPGDVIRVSVSGIPQLEKLTLRVSEQDTISLPLLGQITVNGMTLHDLLGDITRRAKKYLYNPQVRVFLVHSENRNVSVLGAVSKPGRYMLTSRSDTIMTMISRAGGLMGDSASRIVLIPSPMARSGAASDKNLTGVSAGGFQNASDQVPGNTSAPRRASNEQSRGTETDPAEQLFISTSRAEDQRYLALPALPGDVIVVPTAGQVSVQGWVDKPGAFPITPGMTVLGSIAAAGGSLFSSTATLLREQSNGRQLELALDLDKMAHGRQSDPTVQGGDVVVVRRSVVGAIPYGVYFLAEHMGVGLPLPAIP